MKRALLVILVVVIALTISAQRLVINSYMSDPAPRRVFAELVDQFRDLYPEYDVVVNTFPHEDFKTLLRTWLGSSDAPDVVTWFAGERMRFFASRGLLEPIDDIFPQGFEADFPAAFKSASSHDGKIYFLPQSWYWWGVYYNTEVFDELGLSVPVTWKQFLDVCQTLKDAGKIPITIGTRFLWTAAGWFDYLNMRVNGLDYHLKLTEGVIPYTDEGVKRVFDYWGQLAEKGYFLDNHTSYNWQDAANFLFTGEAGMYLMGQFIKDVAPEAVKDNIDFFRFPIIDGNIGVYEDTPIDGFMIPAGARNKDGAKVFLQFIASREAQEYFATELGRLAANKHVPAPDAHAKKGLEMILGSDGVMQFYDRDTDPEMAEAGMNAFVEFMVFPNRVETLLSNLEKERQRIFE
ncbi:MAG TPA: sugar ABC transporter substrate-binding protein [Kosmotogaceae bacterium]|nr:MAG: Extracellular solute-binding protein family 1 [Thermotogales bacterium 46_20]HAA86126.1 sugar ABC transporter substrate-binding protein [Kosmotogaceae bacterium]